MLFNRSCPASTVIPEIPYADPSQAAAWLADAFGFTIRLRIANHRIQMNVGDGAIVCIDLRGHPTIARTMVRIEDADAHHARAVAKGAHILQPPTTYPYGERQYSVEDPSGHIWRFTQSVADIDPADWGGETGKL
jgi:uncharacterized glyoxalase superfamily protein PhnB